MRGFTDMVDSGVLEKTSMQDGYHKAMDTKSHALGSARYVNLCGDA